MIFFLAKYMNYSNQKSIFGYKQFQNMSANIRNTEVWIKTVTNGKMRNVTMCYCLKYIITKFTSE